MPKSRNPKATRRGDRQRPSDRPYRSITSQMTPAYDRAVRESADAELRGDAATALRLHRSVPFFRQSTHGDRLQLISELGTDCPPWLVSRWLTVQARRRMWTGGDQLATNRVLQLVVPLIYPDSIPFEAIGCDYVEQVLPYIYERDWVVRQVDVYDLGGLRRLVELHASPGLLGRAEHVEDWLYAPMRACRIEAVGDGVGAPTTVTDLTSSEVVEVVDRGFGSVLATGQHVLGRIVPTGDAPGARFEWRPLAVDPETSEAVAADPRQWLPTLARLARAGHLAPAFSHQSETSLTAELPIHSWMSLLGTPMDDAPEQDPRPVVARALREGLALAEGGAEAVVPLRHVLSELVLDVASAEAVRRFVGRDYLSSWLVLADVVAEPARSRCLQMALWSDATSDVPDAIA